MSHPHLLLADVWIASNSSSEVSRSSRGCDRDIGRWRSSGSRIERLPHHMWNALPDPGEEHRSTLRLGLDHFTPRDGRPGRGGRGRAKAGGSWSRAEAIRSSDLLCRCQRSAAATLRLEPTAEEASRPPQRMAREERPLAAHQKGLLSFGTPQPEAPCSAPVHRDRRSRSGPRRHEIKRMRRDVRAPMIRSRGHQDRSPDACQREREPASG